MRGQEHDVRASVIVIGYNGSAFLSAAIASLLDQDLAADDFEVIYVDNHSVDGSAHLVETAYPAVRVLRLKENVGFYRAFNLAADLAVGEYLVAVPQDVIAHRRWLPEMLHHADGDERALVAVTNTIAPGSPDYHPERRDGDVSECTWVSLSRLGFVRLDRGPFTATPRRTLACAGCSALLRRDLVERSGCLFESRVGHYSGDVELGIRANVVGGSVLQVPTAVIYHVGEERKRTTDLKLLVRYAEGARDQVLMFYKTMTTAEFVLFLPLMLVGLSLKASVLRVPMPARVLLVCGSFVLSPFVALAALARLHDLHDAKQELLRMRQVPPLWLLRSILGGATGDVVEQGRSRNAGGR